MEQLKDIHPATGLFKGSFGIGTYRTSDGRSFPGLVHPDGRTVDLSARWRDTHEIFDAWERNFDALVEWGTVSPEDLGLFRMCDTPQEAFAYLSSRLEELYLQGPGRLDEVNVT